MIILKLCINSRLYIYIYIIYIYIYNFTLKSKGYNEINNYSSDA